MKSSRITVDLGNPALIRLLKNEGQETQQAVKDVVVHALEAYFFHRLETRALMRASESVFEEWNNPLDSEYDDL